MRCKFFELGAEHMNCCLLIPFDEKRKRGGKWKVGGARKAEGITEKLNKEEASKVKGLWRGTHCCNVVCAFSFFR